MNTPPENPSFTGGTLLVDKGKFVSKWHAGLAESTLEKMKDNVRSSSMELGFSFEQWATDEYMTPMVVEAGATLIQDASHPYSGGARKPDLTLVLPCGKVIIVEIKHEANNRAIGKLNTYRQELTGSINVIFGKILRRDMKQRRHNTKREEVNHDWVNMYTPMINAERRQLVSEDFPPPPAIGWLAINRKNNNVYH